jgi:aerobic carbon-monoxide dehydrogenase medium subunit
VFPAAVEFTAPQSLDEALDTLSARGEDAKVLAGGQSLIPLLRLRFAAPDVLVDVRRIPGLSSIEQQGSSLVIGALARHVDVIDAPVVAERLPMLRVAGLKIADPQVRNLGTIGGSLAHADPEGDWASVLLALRAELTIASTDGTRTVAMREFLLGMFTTALEPHELLTSIRIPLAPDARMGGDYQKLSRRVGDFAAVGVATCLTVRDKGLMRKHPVIQSAGIALTALGPVNHAVEEAEQAIVGAEPTSEVFARAADIVAASVDPHDDLRGSADYKRAVVREYVRRGLERSAQMAA